MKFAAHNTVNTKQGTVNAVQWTINVTFLYFNAAISKLFRLDLQKNIKRISLPIHKNTMVTKYFTFLSHICRGLLPMLYKIERNPLWKVFLNISIYFLNILVIEYIICNNYPVISVNTQNN